MVNPSKFLYHILVIRDSCRQSNVLRIASCASKAVSASITILNPSGALCLRGVLIHSGFPNTWNLPGLIRMNILL